MNEDLVESLREAAREKADDLREFFYAVKKTLSSRGIEATLNTLFLADACESCFIDLERHRDFHKLEIPDRHKRAAFLFKWLAKTRPISLPAYRQGPGAGMAIHVNACFALMAVLGELEIDVHGFSATRTSQHSIYEASYRNINAESWALTFCLMEMAFPKN